MTKLETEIYQKMALVVKYNRQVMKIEGAYQKKYSQYYTVVGILRRKLPPISVRFRPGRAKEWKSDHRGRIRDVYRKMTKVRVFK